MNSAMKDLIKLYKAFLICFVIYAVASLVIGSVILREIRAVDHCMAVEDSQFNACYHSNKGGNL